MSELILSDNLELTNIAKMTANRVKNLKLSELDLLLLDIPSGYRKAIVRLVKDLAVEKDEGKKEEKYSSLGQMIEQVIFINMQAQVSKMLDTNIPESLKRQAD